MVTRKDYMDGKATFAEYYRDVNAGLSPPHRMRDEAFLQRVEAALADGDEHLNTIPLAVWDGMAQGLETTYRPRFKARGDQWSMAGMVCAMKQAARDAVQT